jgi:hypothetical protein
MVDVSLESHYVIEIESTSEEKAQNLAKKLVLSGQASPVEQEIDVFNIYESGGEEEAE